jgi:hypothetical protein
MRTIFRKTILLFICLMPIIGAAQEAKPASAGAPIANRAQRKKAKKKWKEDRIIERDNKKAIKDHHKRIQTKKTLKAMKKEKKKGDKMRSNKKENFFIRIFKR